MLASSLWSTYLSGEDLWRDTRYVVYILGFVLLTAVLHNRDERLIDTLLDGVVIVAGVTAALLMGKFLHGSTGRGTRTTLPPLHRPTWNPLVATSISPSLD